MSRDIYWLRRAVVSFPLWAWFVHEADTRRYDDGVRVFADYQGMILWTVLFFLGWSLVDMTVRDTRVRRNRGRVQSKRNK